METVIRDHEEVITGQTHMLEERWSTMQSMEAMVRDRDLKLSLAKQHITTKQALRELLSAVKASIRHRINQVLGKNR
jgi:4-hydroxy-L-threonine phosphate dehydrogenase PdxA